MKVFVDEPGRAEVGRALGRSSAVASAMVSYAEARATFARLLREGRLTEEEHSGVVRALDARWMSYERPPLTDELVRVAGELAFRHALRGYDAVQLASAVACRARREAHGSSHEVRFMSFDSGLNQAATNVVRLYDAGEDHPGEDRPGESS